MDTDGGGEGRKLLKSEPSLLGKEDSAVCLSASNQGPEDQEWAKFGTVTQV